MSVQDQPTGSYALLMSVFATLATAFGVIFRRSGRELPERMAPSDVLLLSIASHKLARIVAKDKVTRPLRAPFTVIEGSAGPSELSEQPRPGGLRRAIGELLGCAFCLSMWTSAAFTAGLLTWPRLTRWVAAVLTTFFGSELLQIAYKHAEDSLS